jgi:hypothetical protein
MNDSSPPISRAIREPAGARVSGAAGAGRFRSQTGGNMSYKNGRNPAMGDFVRGARAAGVESCVTRVYVHTPEIDIRNVRTGALRTHCATADYEFVRRSGLRYLGRRSAATVAAKPSSRRAAPAAQ